jgi:hypothetical protein
MPRTHITRKTVDLTTAQAEVVDENDLAGRGARQRRCRAVCGIVRTAECQAIKWETVHASAGG